MRMIGERNIMILRIFTIFLRVFFLDYLTYSIHYSVAVQENAELMKNPPDGQRRVFLDPSWALFLIAIQQRFGSHMTYLFIFTASGMALLYHTAGTPVQPVLHVNQSYVMCRMRRKSITVQRCKRLIGGDLQP